MTKAFASQGDLTEKTISFVEVGKGLWAFTAEGDPNSGVVGDVFQAARRGKWKAVQYGKNAQVQLFDLENDPLELNDISDQYPIILQEMILKLRQYQETFVPQQPSSDPSCPFTGPVNTTVGPTW